MSNRRLGERGVSTANMDQGQKHCLEMRREKEGGGVSTANVDKGQKNAQMEDMIMVNVDEGQKHAQMGDVSMVNVDKGRKRCLETRRERGGGCGECG